MAAHRKESDNGVESARRVAGYRPYRRLDIRVQGLLDFLRGARFERVSADHLHQLLLIFKLEKEEEEAHRHLFDSGWMFYDGDGSGEWRRDNLASALESLTLNARLNTSEEIPTWPTPAAGTSARRDGHQDEDDFRWH